MARSGSWSFPGPNMTPGRVVEVSFVHRPQFKRLVEFVEEVYAHAEANEDGDLFALLDRLRDDLVAMHR